MPVVGEQTGVDDCGSGLLCWEGECVALCKGSVDAPLCPAMHHGKTVNDAVINICVFECDPLAQDQPGLSCASFFEMGEVPAGDEDVGACTAS